MLIEVIFYPRSQVLEKLKVSEKTLRTYQSQLMQLRELKLKTGYYSAVLRDLWDYRPQDKGFSKEALLVLGFWKELINKLGTRQAVNKLPEVLETWQKDLETQSKN